jgi:hypothetical protein
MTDIWELIETRLRASAEADPRDVAAAISHELGDDLKAKFFDQMLPAVCVSHNSRIRRTSTVPTPREETTPRPSRSSKVAAIRNHPWATQLSNRYKVGDTWKFLREMTYDDLTVVADDRRQRAAQNTAVADRFERLASQIRRAGVTTVGQLGADDGLLAWNGEAA